MNALMIDATRRDDLNGLAGRLASLEGPSLVAAVAVAHELGLMQFRALAMRLVVRILRKINGGRGLRVFFENLGQRDPASLAAFRDQMIDHILNGRDREDPHSAGGWSQREVDLFLSHCPLTAAAE